MRTTPGHYRIVDQITIGLEKSYRIERETVEKIYGAKQARRAAPQTDS